MTLMDRFDLLRPLGMGASGAVFEAVDRANAQIVALKLLHRADAVDLYRIKSEFRALAEITHPNLVAMHELFIDEQQRGFFTMDVIHGQTFLDYVRPNDGDPDKDAVLDEPRLRASLEQLTHGVQHLHAHGKMHRDLKPSNVLVRANGALTIVDFGLVQSLREAAGPGCEPEFEGTPAYAAPEQIHSRNTSLASDWYAVGVMMYEALTGQRPFPGNEAEVMKAKTERDPLPPSQIVADPVPEALESVCMRLLARDPEQRADGSELLAALGTAEQVRAAEPQRPFVGRAGELAELERCYKAALRGEWCALLIAGPSGIGKTSLALQFLEQLRERDRALVLRARCYVQEALHYNALDGIVDALANYVRQLPADAVSQLLPLGIDALAQLFPVLRRIPALDAGEDEGPQAPRDDVRAVAFAALRELLSRLAAGKPVVLFIDDLQWADADSARLLRELLSPAIPSVWVFATYRSDVDSGVLHRAGALEHFRRLPLGPLTESAVVHLAQNMIRDCPTSRASEIARKSGGHPLLAGELIRHTRERADGLGDDPIVLEDALRVRLASLSRAARSLLALVSVAGQRLPRSIAMDSAPTRPQGGSAVLEPSAAPLARNPVAAPQLAALRELRLASTIRVSIVDGELHLEPYHDRIREVALSELSDATRRALHGQLAERMRALGAPYLERVVQHYVLADRESEAATLAEQAADQAMRGLAFHGAADFYEIALRYAPDSAQRARLRLAAADACMHAGRSLAGAKHYDEAGTEQADPSQRRELQLRALTAYCVSGHSQRGRELLEQLARELSVPLLTKPISFPQGLASFMLMLTTGAPFLRGEGARRASDDPQYVALRFLWRSAPALLVVDPYRSAYFTTRALSLAAQQGERSVYGQALAYHLTVFTMITGRPSWLVDRAFVRARSLVQDDGDFWDHAFVRVAQAGSDLLTARLARAVDGCDDVANATRLGSSFAACVRTYARSVVVPALYGLGRVARQSELVEAWLREAIDTGDRHMEVEFRITGFVRHLRRDDVARAIDDIEAAHGIELDYLHPAFCDPYFEACVRLYQGRPDLGLAHCDALRERYHLYARYSDPQRLTWNITEGLCAAALAASGERRQEAIALLERCVKRASRCFSVPSRAWTLQLRASLHWLRGQRAEAVSQLRAAIDAFDALGLRLQAASLRLCLARSEPAQAESLEREARAVFDVEGIATPERWVAMLSPGFDP